MNFKPMLSASLDGVDLSTLRYPLVVSPKLDGVRCIVWEGVAYSRNAKPIRNHFVQKWAKDLHNLDGELIVGPPTIGNVLGRTQSGVMSYEGEPDFTFWVFDAPATQGPGELGFIHRRQDAINRVRGLWRISPVPHYTATTLNELLSFEDQWLEAGYEGIMLRDPYGPYKNGRSTLREGYLMKLKRFTDGEAVVLALEEGHHNTNELERDELGRAKRSKDSAGLVGSGMVGTIIVKDSTWGELRVAPGIMTHAERQAYWREYQMGHHHSLKDKIIHWRSFGYGVKEKPRFPRFYGVREDL